MEHSCWIVLEAIDTPPPGCIAFHLPVSIQISAWEVGGLGRERRTATGETQSAKGTWVPGNALCKWNFFLHAKPFCHAASSLCCSSLSRLTQYPNLPCLRETEFRECCKCKTSQKDLKSTIANCPMRCCEYLGATGEARSPRVTCLSKQYPAFVSHLPIGGLAEFAEHTPMAHTKNFMSVGGDSIKISSGVRLSCTIYELTPSGVHQVYILFLGKNCQLQTIFS